MNPARKRVVRLTVALSGFPTEAILKHLDFYWRGALGLLKDHLER